MAEKIDTLHRGNSKMNRAAQIYWKTFWEEKGELPPKNVSAWAFGTDPDHLAQLVIDGVKTATSSGLIFYQKEGEPIPLVGAYSIILNSKEEPVAIIKTTGVKVMPMNEVPEDFASAEGDRSYDYWWAVHKLFFTKELAKIGLEFRDNLLVVCEYFKCVDVKK